MIKEHKEILLALVVMLGLSSHAGAETSAQDGHATLNTFVENRETTSSNAERSTTTAENNQIGHSGGIPSGFGKVESNANSGDLYRSKGSSCNSGDKEISSMPYYETRTDWSKYGGWHSDSYLARGTLCMRK